MDLPGAHGIRDDSEGHAPPFFAGVTMVRDADCEHDAGLLLVHTHVGSTTHDDKVQSTAAAVAALPMAHCRRPTAAIIH